MQQQALFWIFVSIFTVTAIITLLGITGVLKNIKENYLNALFTALILEVIAAVIFVFRGMDYSGGAQAQGPCLEEVLERSGLGIDASGAADATDFLVRQLEELALLRDRHKDLASLPGEIARRDSALEAAAAQVAALEEELNQLGRQFYTKITRLRNYISDYGGFINLAWRPEEKAAVYRLLIEVFGDMGLIENEGSLYKNGDESEIDTEAICRIYMDYKKELQQPAESKTKVYLGEYDTILFIRTYLNQTGG